MIDPTKKVFSLLDEFKKFALKGNVIDLAVAVVVGTAFGKVVESLVKNIIMPLIAALGPREMGYETWVIPLGSGIPVGLFVGDVVNFLIVALAMFLFIVKFLGFIVRHKREDPPPPLTKDQQLLVEIRDLLKRSCSPASHDDEPHPVDPQGVTANLPPEPKRP